MSMNSELRVRLERLGPVRAAVHDRLFSDQLVDVMLQRRPGPFTSAVTVARRLFSSGMSLRAAHAAINDLAAKNRAFCKIPTDGGIDALAHDLAALDVDLHRRRVVEDVAAYVTAVRDRHGFSQSLFAAVLGVDPSVLEAWEQGQRRPDDAVLRLIAVFDRNPRLVEDVLFERVT